MNSRQSRRDKLNNNELTAQSQKNENDESVDELLANVDQFIEGVYRDLSISPPRRSTPGNSTNIRSLESSTSSSSSAATSPAGPSLLSNVTSGTEKKKTVLSPVVRRNMDAEIERINQICDNVDQNLRSIGLFMNSSSPNSLTVSLSNTNITTTPAASTSIIIVNNTSPSVVHRVRLQTSAQRRGTPSMATPVDSFVDLSNSQTETPVTFRQPVDPRNDDDDDDDVILVSANIPSVVDLCTPGGNQEISRPRPINHDHLNRRRLHSNNDLDEVNSCCGGPSSTRKRRTMSSIRPTETTTSPVKETTSVTSSDGRTPFMCPVCMESCLNRQPTSTVCGHVFCKLCIEQAIAMTKKCPMCNKKISGKQTFRIYF